MFEQIDSLEKAYWLGYLYCDGNVTRDERYVRLGSKDKDAIDKWEAFLGRPITRWIEKDKYYRSSLGSKVLVSQLMPYGIIPNKTYDHSVPIYIPKGELERHFWRGCIDADGSLGFNYQKKTKWRSGNFRDKIRIQEVIKVTLANNNPALLTSCVQFFNAGGICKPGLTWQVGGTRQNILSRVLNKIYKDAPIHVRLERKYQKYLEIEG